MTKCTYNSVGLTLLSGANRLKSMCVCVCVEQEVLTDKKSLTNSQTRQAYLSKAAVKVCAIRAALR